MWSRQGFGVRALEALVSGGHGWRKQKEGLESQEGSRVRGPQSLGCHQHVGCHPHVFMLQMSCKLGLGVVL